MLVACFMLDVILSSGKCAVVPGGVALTITGDHRVLGMPEASFHLMLRWTVVQPATGRQPPLLVHDDLLGAAQGHPPARAIHRSCVYARLAAHEPVIHAQDRFLPDTVKSESFVQAHVGGLIRLQICFHSILVHLRAKSCE